MNSDSEFASWSVMELLSIHEIACLCVGANPTLQNGGKFAPPSVPEDLLSQVDQNDIDQEYWSIVRILQRALEAKVIEPTVSGKITPKIAATYLDQTAKQLKSDWTESCDFIKHVKSLEPLSKETDELKSIISGLETELARYKSRETYTTPMLNMVHQVIDEFYAGKTNYPKNETVLIYLSDQLINGCVISNQKKHAIWAVASHPSQAKGGLKSLKNKIKHN